MPGFYYDVGNLLGAYLLAEGWAEPVDSFSPAMLIPLDDFGDPPRDRDVDDPLNLKREHFPPYYDGPPIALDRRRRRRHL